VQRPRYTIGRQQRCVVISDDFLRCIKTICYCGNKRINYRVSQVSGSVFRVHALRHEDIRTVRLLVAANAAESILVSAPHVTHAFNDVAPSIFPRISTRSSQGGNVGSTMPYDKCARCFLDAAATLGRPAGRVKARSFAIGPAQRTRGPICIIRG